ncbi:MAG: TIGR02147 family protein [Fibrobacteria bacterium]|nr:TIGR02147 family protein [Fibrobacteria bacterium]
MEAQKPDIFLYLGYRDYLRDIYYWKKQHEKGFSYRKFSCQAGVSSPNFLERLITGKRNLLPATAKKISRALSHSPEECEYFRNMVLFDQSVITKEKVKYFKVMNQLRKPYNIDPLADCKMEHYQHWYFMAIRHLLCAYPFNPSAKYAYRILGSMLSPPVSEKEARRAVKVLKKLGLVEKRPDGTIGITEKYLSTGDEVGNLLVKHFHEVMLKKAGECMDRFPAEQRDVSSLTVCVSDEMFSLIKQEFQLFRKRLVEKIKSDTDPRNVYQINFQLFPLSDHKRLKEILG